MDVDLSRRAGKVTGITKAYNDLSRTEQESFIDAVMDAKSFDTLPARWKKVILDGEQELRTQV